MMANQELLGKELMTDAELVNLGDKLAQNIRAFAYARTERERLACIRQVFLYADAIRFDAQELISAAHDA